MNSTKAKFGGNASSLALCLVPAISAAQTAEPVLEEIAVTGIRSSLERAVAKKRSASGLVDAIAAEDLGKFPETNIAEALQRVPGVTIDRNGGEGQFVTVRGFGPSFNTVLVNGRRIASEVGNREFSFDLFPSELITGSLVYKNGVARLQEGGIGATINLTTARPLDQSGFQSVIVGRGLYDDNSEEISPQFFALVSNTFAEDTMGVLVSASYQERESEVLTFNNRGWNSGLVADLAPTVNVVNPHNVERFFVAQNLQLGQTLQSRERTNIQTVFQYKPSDDLVVTLDGMWNEFELKSESRFLNTWFSLTDLDNLVLDANGTVLHADQNGNGAIEARAQNDGRPTQTQMMGFNVQWTPSDTLQNDFDLSFSHAENDPKGADTGQSVLGFRSPFTLVNDGSRAFPYTQFTVPSAEVLDPANYLFHVSQFGGDGDSKEAGNVVDTDLVELRYDGVFTPETEGISAIRFGLHYSTEEKDVDIKRTNQTALCTYCGFFVNLPSSVENQLLFNVSNNLLGNGGFVDSNGQSLSNYFGNTVAGDIAVLQTAEMLLLRDSALGLAPGTSQAQFEALSGFAAQKRPESFSVEEDIFAMYVDIDLEGQVGGIPWTLNAGFRWVRTGTASTGAKTPLLDIRRNPLDTTEYLQELGDTANAVVKEKNDYTFFLPNLSLKLDLTDELVFRFGASQTITRAQLTDLSPRLAILNTRPNNLVAVGGNAELEPFSSNNLDLGLEYYLDDFNYVAVSGFWKEVDNFIVQTTGREIFTIANADAIVDPRINGTSASFDVTRPTNSETATVKGVELSGQYLFDYLPAPFDGLGVVANMLFVDSNAEVGQNSQERVNFGLPGLSDAQNVQLFYSKGPWDARISYSHRDEFLETLSNVIGGEPIFVQPFEQVDFKVTYTIGDTNYSVFIEGLNIFNEEIRKTGRFDNHFLEFTDTGSRFALGFRGAF